MILVIKMIVMIFSFSRVPPEPNSFSLLKCTLEKVIFIFNHFSFILITRIIVQTIR